MKVRILLSAFLAAFFANVLAAQVVFTIQATPSITATAFGYTADTSYTFVFQTGSSYVDTLPYSEFTSTSNYWREEDLPDGQLFLSVAGSGLQGTFERPISDEESPQSSIDQRDNGTLILYAGSDVEPSISLSALDNTPLKDLQVRLLGLNFSSPAFSESYVDPVSYFTNHLGTYVPGVGSEVRFYIANFDPYVGFTATSLTISAAAVPEPATVALGLGVAALGVVLIRRRRGLANAS